MPSNYPHDQFDDLPADAPRVGAHRGPARRGRGWITFAWAALATGVLVAGGVVAVSVMGGVADASVDDTLSSTATAEPTAEPLTDPTTLDDSRDISITILNGTPYTGLATIAETELTDLKWPVGSAADAQSTEHASTTVFYAKAEDEDVARGVSQALTVGDVQLDETLLGAPIKVVLGADYQALQDAG